MVAVKDVYHFQKSQNVGLCQAKKTAKIAETTKTGLTLGHTIKTRKDSGDQTSRKSISNDMIAEINHRAHF